MKSLTAAELKRRGMTAIEEGLRRGPVHLIKGDKVFAVIVSPAAYARLLRNVGDDLSGLAAGSWLLEQPLKGTKSKRQIDQDLRAERDAWK